METEVETYTGIESAPSSSIEGVQVGVGARLDPMWSVESALRYGGGSGERSGLAFSGLLSAIYHYRHLGVGLGVGVAGISELRDARLDPYGDLMSEVVASYTVASDRPPLSQCVGFGPLIGATLEYRFPLTSIMTLHIAARADRSRVACELSTDRVEPDSARGIVLRQYWEGWSWSWMGGLSWR